MIFGTGTGTKLAAWKSINDVREEPKDPVVKAKADESVAPVRWPTNGQPLEENKSSIEYLQRAIACLLHKNETIRFELFAIRKKIGRIDRALFGAGSQELRSQIPSHVISMLSELCGSQGAGDRSNRTAGRNDDGSQTE